MTRMWGIDPALLCRQHLLGEHNELHKLVGSIRAGHSIEGYVERGQVDTARIERRHESLVAEMEQRGYNHASPISYEDTLKQGTIDEEANLRELSDRCPRCRARIEEQHGL